MGRGRQERLLAVGARRRVYDFLFTDPNEPDIDWIIYKRKIWTRATWRKRSWGSDDFTWHDDHIHSTYTGGFRILD